MTERLSAWHRAHMQGQCETDLPLQLRAAFEESGIPSLAAVARQIGESEDKVRRWFRGDNVPQLSGFAKLARELGLSMDELYWGDA